MPSCCTPPDNARYGMCAGGRAGSSQDPHGRVCQTAGYLGRGPHPEFICSTLGTRGLQRGSVSCHARHLEPLPWQSRVLPDKGAPPETSPVGLTESESTPHPAGGSQGPQ